ncbi:DNA primase [Desulfitispora alkaliphila]
MQQRIPEEIIEEIKARLDIVQVIGEALPLQKKGKNYHGLCPFHSEKTPSFSVNQEKQFYYCFGCGAAGNIINFMMNYHGQTFLEVISGLADRAGVVLPQREETEEEKAKRKHRERLREVNELAGKYFHYLLKESDVGRLALEYLNKRGLTVETINKFNLGYAPNNWDSLIKVATKRGFSEKELLQAGLVISRERGSGYYDRFRNRVMFPIYNPSGRVIGFGGRVLDDSHPKYLNTPETPIFNKKNNLYALNWSGQEMKSKDQGIVVEGYMDVIVAQQYGIENIVATLGTAFTREQAQLIARYTSNVVIAYDSDVAGQAATLRGMEILRDAGCRVNVMQLPHGCDPDDYLRKYGKQKFISYFNNEAVSLVEYKLKHAIDKYGLSSISGKAKIVQALIGDLERVESAVEKEHYIGVIASRLEISETAVKQELERISVTRSNNKIEDKNVKNRYTNQRVKSKDEGIMPARKQAEQQLFWLMLEDQQIMNTVEAELGDDFFTDKTVCDLYNKAKQLQKERDKISPSVLMDRCTENEELELLGKLFAKDIDSLSNVKQLVKDYTNILKQSKKQERIRQLQKELHEAETTGNQTKTIVLLTKIQQLVSSD